MMRWVLFAVAVAGLASVATVAVQYVPMSAATPDRVAFPVGTSAKSSADRSAAPKAVLEGDPTFEFGNLPQETTGTHSWVVKNVGRGDLEIWMIKATCSCTLAKFKDGKKATVKPGESTEITLEYETRGNNGDFRKGAEIGTSDPDLPEFSLYVHGQVHPAVTTLPPGGFVNFMNISNDKEDNQYHLALFSQDRPGLKILKTSSSESEGITITSEPMSAADAQSVDAGGGYKVTVHLNPNGMPLGTFRREAVITTDHPKQPLVRLTITGKLSGPVNVIPENLQMHQVDGKVGASRDLIVSVRSGRETKFTVDSTPKNLKAEIAPSGMKGRYRLTVTVPPGSPAQEIEGEIVLKSDHPKADKVTLPVSVWVQRVP